MGASARGALARDAFATDASAMDVFAMDVSAMDVSATDVSAMDVSAMDASSREDFLGNAVARKPAASNFLAKDTADTVAPARQVGPSGNGCLLHNRGRK